MNNSARTAPGTVPAAVGPCVALAKVAKQGRPPSQEVASEFIEVAQRLFFAHGFAGTSMEMIASETKRSKSTLYTRFTSKEALFEYVVNSLVQELPALPTNWPNKHALADQLHHAARLIAAFAISPKTMTLQRLLYRQAGLFPELAERIELSIKAELSGFVENILLNASAAKPLHHDLEFLAEQFVVIVTAEPLRQAALAASTEFQLSAEFHGKLRRSIEFFIRGCGLLADQPGNDLEPNGLDTKLYLAISPEGEERQGGM